MKPGEPLTKVLEIGILCADCHNPMYAGTRVRWSPQRLGWVHLEECL